MDMVAITMMQMAFVMTMMMMMERVETATWGMVCPVPCFDQHHHVKPVVAVAVTAAAVAAAVVEW
jgi:hypothetical protein